MATLQPPPEKASETVDPTLKEKTDIVSKFAHLGPNNRHVTTYPPAEDPAYNPFLPWFNPITGNWRGPRYGMRQQADLCKIARRYGLEALLPYTPKKLDEKLKRKDQLGLRVRGTGVGQKVKGHKWERTMGSKLEERRKAMLNMPDMIREWKEVSFAVLFHLCPSLAS
jgi:large subunit ribosomal protein L25